MAILELEVLVSDDSIIVGVDWNNCPVGLDSPQPDWLIENGGTCFCRCISAAPHDAPTLTNYKCQHFIGLTSSTDGMEINKVFCSYSK